MTRHDIKINRAYLKKFSPSPVPNYLQAATGSRENCFTLNHACSGLVRCHSSSQKIHLKATECHVPYGITQRCLPPDTGERALS